MINKNRGKVAYKIIIASALLSLIWSTAPFFGWSFYSLEGGLTSCSVEWADRSWNVLSYNVTIWIFGFLVPLALIVYCNIHIIKKVGVFFNLFF
jgi:hypothetical protein